MTTILLVEDNEMNRDMLSRRLLRRGYKVIIAVDGAEGISMATEKQPDIILLDMSLPAIDGWEAVRQLKQSIKTNNIPVIGLSAHAMNTDRQRALEAGCDDYESKPIDFDSLIDKIKSHT